MGFRNTAVVLFGAVVTLCVSQGVETEVYAEQLTLVGSSTIQPVAEV